MSIGRNRFVNWSCAVSGNFMWHLTKGQKSLLQTGRGSEQFLFPVSLEALLMATFGLFQEYITQCSWGKKLWQKFAGVHSWWGFVYGGGGGVRGDFNVNHFPSERVEAERISTAMWDFCDFISN